MIPDSRSIVSVACLHDRHTSCLYTNDGHLQFLGIDSFLYVYRTFPVYEGNTIFTSFHHNVNLIVLFQDEAPLQKDTFVIWPMSPYCIFQIIYIFRKQNRSTEGCSKLKRSVGMTSSGKNGLNIKTNASPNWTGPGIRRSKRPLLASRTRCNVLWKPLEIW